MIDIWVEKPKGRDFLIDAMDDSKDYDKNISYIVQKCKIEEMIFESDGSIYASIDTDNGIGFSLNIPFQEWFGQAIRFGWFDDIADFLDDHKGDIKTVREQLSRCTESSDKNV